MFGMRLHRYFLLEREFQLVTRRMADCKVAAHLSQLSEHRNGVIVEAREILRTLDVTEPTWCCAKYPLSRHV